MSTEQSFATGVVIGKFLPPHRGHKLLIDTAQSRCQKLTVIICGKPNDFVAAETRAAWLRAIHPQVTVLLIDDCYDENDSRVWAENTVQWLGYAPQAVFTSEDYGDRYAALMGSVHICVDKARLAVPCSGTAVRQNPWAMRDYLEPVVRAWFVKRVCVLGAESTGTTTLSMALAEHYQTVWVAEYGREYSLLKQAAGETEWVTEEFADIATEQARREDAAALEANRVLICDTNAFATTLWHRRYMGFDSEAVARVAARGRCDLYLLTGDEIPFTQDGLRDGKNIRHEMHRWFEESLAAQNVPWEKVIGPPEMRLARAVAIIDSLPGRP